MVPADPASNPVELPPGRGRLAALALAAGLLAGGASWLSGEAILSAYRADLNPRVQRGSNLEAGRRFARARLASPAATFAASGAILGLALGLAGGLARRSAPAGARAALVGGAVGSIAGASASLLAVPLFYRGYDPQSQDLLPPLLTLGSICSAVGASGALAFGVGLGGRGRWWKAAAGGLVGAMLGTVAYEVVGAIAFPVSKTELPIAQDLAPRALLHLLVAGLASIGAALALGLSSKARVDPAGPAG